eukprot:6211777-Pleurochrysis_carterae.AAC.3
MGDNKDLRIEYADQRKERTAWSGVYYNKDGRESDITGWEIVLPNKEKSTETYRYLGTQLRPRRARGAGSIKDISAGKRKE